MKVDIAGLPSCCGWYPLGVDVDDDAADVDVDVDAAETDAVEDWDKSLVLSCVDGNACGAAPATPAALVLLGSKL